MRIKKMQKNNNNNTTEDAFLLLHCEGSIGPNVSGVLTRSGLLAPQNVVVSKYKSLRAN